MKKALALGMALAGAWLWAQDAANGFSMHPSEPVAGDVVVIVVDLPGMDPTRISFKEPELEGPAGYLASSIGPRSGGGSRLEFRFQTSGPGTVTVRELRVAAGSQAVVVGPWSFVVGQKEGALLPRPGEWLAPRSVYRFQPFAVSARGTGGEALRAERLAAEGVLFEPASDGLSWLVLATATGQVRLPALELDGETGKVAVAGTTVQVKAIPPRSAANRAVGRWSLRLSLLSGERRVQLGSVVPVQASAVGSGSVGVASPPIVRVTGPDGGAVAFDHAGGVFGAARVLGDTFEGERSIRGSFKAERPGRYLVSVEPYAWFDPVNGKEHLATVPDLVVDVYRPETAAVELDTSTLELAEKLATLSGTGGRPAARDLRAAADALLGGEPAVALHRASKAERAPFPPAGAAVLADAAARSLGFSDRLRDVLPAPGPLFAAALALAAPAAALFAFRKTRRRGAGGAVLSLVALALACAVLGGAAVVERRQDMLVSFGAPVRTVPDAAAASGFIASPGLQGRVLRDAGDWVFADFGSGRSGWVLAADVGRY